MLWNLFIMPFCQANLLAETVKKTVTDQLETIGFRLSDEMTTSCLELVAFSVQHPKEFTEAGLEMKNSYSSKMEEIYRMIDDLLVGKNTDLFTEIRNFSKTSSKSQFLQELLDKVQNLYSSTISANKDFKVFNLVSDSSFYSKIPIEYRALGFMAISEAKMILGLFSMLNKSQNSLFELYNYLSNGSTGNVMAKAYNFISEDIKKNLTENSAMAEKNQAIKKFYGAAKAMIFGSFGQISAGNLDFEEKLGDLYKKFNEFQIELDNLSKNITIEHEVL